MDLRDHTVAIRDQLQAAQVGGHMADLLSRGCPTLRGGAWAGDPFLWLCWNKIEMRWEVWDVQREKPSRVTRGPIMPDDKRPDHSTFLSVLMHLRDHDFRNYNMDEQLNRLDDHNAQVQKALDDAHRITQVAALEKTYWGLAQDVGHHY